MAIKKEMPIKSPTKNSIKINSLSKREAGSNQETVLISSIVSIFFKNHTSKVLLDGNKIFKIHRSLKEWERILPNSNFIRVTKNVLINLDYVKHIEKQSDNGMIIHMRNFEKPVTMSRYFYKRLRNKFENQKG
jgi:DNA-binding LytR/AlgR family response regulator